MRKIAIGNWKQNPSKLSEAKKIVSLYQKMAPKKLVEIVICPPLPFLSLFSGNKKIAVGAQDVSIEKEGAHTGEVSATQLRTTGVTHVIIGHSERRAMGETSEVVSKKVQAALKAKLSPVICIGEKERHHEGEHWSVLSRELHASLQGVSKAQIKDCIIAYEPIWAIGKGASVMKQSDIGESAIFIKKILAEMFGTKLTEKVRVIYGGSVDAKNARECATASGISGFLVGRESLKPANFIKVAEALQ